MGFMSAVEECPIWGTKALLVESRGDSLMIDSPRAGGKYKITGSALAVLEGNPFDQKENVKLTDWLVDQREKGIKEPEINTRILEDAKDRPEKTVQERTNSLILYLAENYGIGEKLFFMEMESMASSHGEVKIIGNTVTPLMAYSSSTRKEEMDKFLEALIKNKYLEVKGDYQEFYSVTREGKEYAEEISQKNNQKSDQKTDKQNLKCFVSMWFDENKEGMEDVYEKAIEPAIKDAGYEPCRADKIRHEKQIDTMINEQIIESHFMLADFTAEKEKPRAGVYFEAGFARGLQRRMIFTCREDRFNPPVNIQNYPHILWKAENLQDFYDEIYLQIKYVIGENENTKEQGFSFAGYKPKQ